ncbi:hypothetical protein HAHE_16700 [Haloferula helveola]|uniref:Uncharacterized protein n=1 Tax=Haloferula helveola TaxID=490095 RepID=A0ABM7RL10_9BACT|nr:hypothetical protein HAHE_16700 [Haloferula helveola]
MRAFVPLLLVTAAFANDTAMHDGGSGPEPVGWTKDAESVIRMEREEVEVEMGPFDSSVTCRFVFVSGKKDAPAIQFLGFPDITRSFSESDNMGPLRDMRTFVNGREVKSEMVSKRMGDDGKWIDLPEPQDPCETWHVVKVSFPPGEEVVVERRFRTDNGRTAGGPVFFGYTTETGGNWRGTIGKGTFTVRLADGLQAAKLDLEPKTGWKKSEDGRLLTLEWKDFEPRTDETRRYWSVGWFPADGDPMQYEKVQGKLEKAYSK